MLKSPNPAIQPNKPRLGQDRAGPRRKMSIPTQVQSKNVNQTREQTLSKQREGIETPLINKLLSDTKNKGQRLV